MFPGDPVCESSCSDTAHTLPGSGSTLTLKYSAKSLPVMSPVHSTCREQPLSQGCSQVTSHQELSLSIPHTSDQ